MSWRNQDAFPSRNPNSNIAETGMSLRDYYAAKALNGMLAHATRYKPRNIDKDLHWHTAIAKEAYEIADALLAERTKNNART